MKISLVSQKHRRSRAGFSLIELLVVVSIIVILAGITIGVMSRVSLKQDISQTRTNLLLVRNALEDYKNEQGFYPVGQDSLSSSVFMALSGDPTGQGQNPTEPIYLPRLNDNDPSLVGMFNGNKVIVDAWGESFRYRSALDANGQPVTNVKNNGDFDLWSIGPDSEPSDVNGSGLLTSEQTQDDIWPE